MRPSTVPFRTLEPVAADPASCCSARTAWTCYHGPCMPLANRRLRKTCASPPTPGQANDPVALPFERIDDHSSNP